MSVTKTSFHMSWYLLVAGNVSLDLLEAWLIRQWPTVCASIYRYVKLIDATTALQSLARKRASAGKT
jgi:hypothetical protein